MGKSTGDNDSSNKKTDTSAVSPRLAIRPGFEHLKGRHSNRYPTEVAPETDPKKFSESLDWLVSFG